LKFSSYVDVYPLALTSLIRFYYQFEKTHSSVIATDIINLTPKNLTVTYSEISVSTTINQNGKCLLQTFGANTLNFNNVTFTEVNVDISEDTKNA